MWRHSLVSNLEGNIDRADMGDPSLHWLCCDLVVDAMEVEVLQQYRAGTAYIEGLHLEHANETALLDAPCLPGVRCHS